jgi:hypothetical protein
MKTLLLTAFTAVLLSTKVSAQQIDPQSRKELEKVVEDFRSSISLVKTKT